ncbi:hypothetical protein B0A49_11478 [Cryomyces minteri]|uniref:FAD-binding domain-containing protein n=1 Tax=Cryomyces minteri TaxID=331657 RepID=A0A4U0WI94_9PEZI|nr:hypothetical protein B0A49_11478 [Cryomyces minteri]
MSTSQDSPKQYDIAVVGGGIGGLCLAVGLLRNKVPIQVYEAAPAFAEIGAGVAFGSNATRAMSLIDPAIKSGFDKRATNNGFDEKRKYWFDFRYGEEKGSEDRVGKLIYELESPAGQSSVHRAHFLEELVKLVPDGVAKFGKRLERVDDKGDHVVLHFHDGSTAKHSALIGCDGIKSRIRQIVLGEQHPAAHAVFTKKYAYRGLIPMDQAARLLGDELARNSQMYLGHHGHVLTFPIENGKTMNVVAFQTKHDGKWEQDARVVPMKKEDMFKDFEGWGKHVRDILSLMQKPDVWALFDHPPAPTYTKGRICLLGDAAHASTPHQGSGAGMAIEDAYVLSSLLGEISKPEELESVFKAYDTSRRGRTQKLVNTSREAGQLYEFELPGVGDDVEKFRENIEHRMAWIWTADLQGQLNEAKKSLKEKANL